MSDERSKRALIGMAIGAAIGFFVPGVGLMAGMAMGSIFGAVWNALDPIEPDTPSIGEPEVSAFNITTAEEGRVIGDLLGISKFTGNIFWYGGERYFEVQESQASDTGKGGGSDSQTYTAYIEYYLSWAVGLCLGPVDTLKVIYKGDEIVWEGTLNQSANGQTITLNGMGTMTFYFGTYTQTANSIIGAKLSNPLLNPALRGFCYAVFNDCLLGKYNRAPTMRFVIQKRPACDWDSAEAYKDIDLDYNPANAIYYILNTMGGLNTSWLDDARFLEMAETLHDEGLGISLNLANAEEVLTYVNYILTHIRGNIVYNENGEFTMNLIRDPALSSSSGGFPEFDEDDLIDEPTIIRSSGLGNPNEVRAEYSHAEDRSV